MIGDGVDGDKGDNPCGFRVSLGDVLCRSCTSAWITGRSWFRDLDNDGVRRLLAGWKLPPTKDDLGEAWHGSASSFAPVESSTLLSALADCDLGIVSRLLS